jgi:hypothetical protein
VVTNTIRRAAAGARARNAGETGKRTKRGGHEKSELLKALREETQRHNLDTFMSAEHKIVQTGCSTCQKHFGTVEQFKRNLSEDVLPPLVNRLSSEGESGGAGEA